MEWRDGPQIDPSDDSLPLVKPRRIDAPHAVLPPKESSLEEVPAAVAADLKSNASPQEASSPECPDFCEVSGEDGSWTLASLAADDQMGLALPPNPQPPEPGDDALVQAEQLGAALAEQLRELEQREAAVAARGDELEQEWRVCQQWHQQQLEELDQRGADLNRRQAEMEVVARREAELAERLTECEALERDVDAREAALQIREAALATHEDELRVRRQEVERQSAALGRSQQLWEQSQQREQAALERQRRQIQAEFDEQSAQQAQALAAEQAAQADLAHDLQRQRQLLRQEQEAWQQQRQHAEEDHARRQRQESEDQDRRLAALTAREAALDTQQAALEQLRGEMTAAYRQALEMRLIAEQLWSQVKGLMTPAEITQSVAQLRLKMSEQYGLEERALVERKEELLALADKLAQQHAALKAQRMEFLSWRKAQQEEVAHQAEHLCRRVQELSEEQKRLRNAELSWHQERRQLEEQLRQSTSRWAA